jgi:hypothetical protein
MPLGSGSVLIPDYKQHPMLGKPITDDPIRTGPIFEASWTHALHCVGFRLLRSDILSANILSSYITQSTHIISSSSTVHLDSTESEMMITQHTALNTSATKSCVWQI